MTDEEYAAALARVDEVVDAWLPVLGLKNVWRITMHMHRDSGDYAEHLGGKETAYGYITIANTYTQWEYLAASIHINMPQFTENDAQEQEEILVHELCHILVAEMRDAQRCDCHPYIISHEERVCTMLSRAFLSTKKWGLEARTATPNNDGVDTSAG